MPVSHLDVPADEVGLGVWLAESSGALVAGTPCCRFVVRQAAGGGRGQETHLPAI